MLVKFRTWLDAARLFLLLICHIGTATSFTIWNPTISCPDDSGSSCHYSDLFVFLTDIPAPDSRGVCQLLNVYIIMASWVPPLLRELNCFEYSIAPNILISKSSFMGLVSRHTRGATPVSLSNCWKMRKREAYSPACGVIPLPSLWIPPHRGIYLRSRRHSLLVPVCVIRTGSLRGRVG